MIIGKCPVCGEDMRVGSDMTNADRIRAMSDEELAEFIEAASCPPICYKRPIYECSKEECVLCWLAWLQAEVKE